MRSTAWLVLAIASCFCAFAERLPTKTYTTADGLGHNHINRIKTDSHGFLWICTDNGVSRFDGQRFFTLTMADGLPHPDVNDIVEDRDGVFWMATNGGVSRFKLRSPGTNERPVIQTFRPAKNPDEHFDESRWTGPAGFGPVAPRDSTSSKERAAPLLGSRQGRMPVSSAWSQPGTGAYG